ncbi:hypothetical protein HNQ36_003620 [Afipia massiliensis]|uniref:Uncharacterized protein n=1 Tax=Afipia massiliensis TaxID=211460 RepID=A0A840N3D9_9BRAD|nr:hypothetical protein [Afipia massiliensis]
MPIAVGFERERVGMRGIAFEIEEVGKTPCGVAKTGVLRDIVNELTAEIDFTAVLKRAKIVLAGSKHVSPLVIYAN